MGAAGRYIGCSGYDFGPYHSAIDKAFSSQKIEYFKPAGKGVTVRVIYAGEHIFTDAGNSALAPHHRSLVDFALVVFTADTGARI